MYSFAASSGKLAWRQSTGNYVYSAAAVGTPPGMGPTVFVGSYDGNFYALDARSGNTIWKYSTGGKISGAPTVVGHIVYFATFKGRTYGLDARTGKLVWSFDDGQYASVVASPDRFYLVGHARLYAMVPK